MNRYMHALIETRKGRDRLKIGRGRRGKVTHSKPKPAGEEGTKAADAEVTRLQNMPKPRRRTQSLKAWTEYQRIGKILAEAARLAVRKEFRKEDPTGYSGPIAQKYGRRRSSTGIRDHKVRAAARQLRKEWKRN